MPPIILFPRHKLSGSFRYLVFNNHYSPPMAIKRAGRGVFDSE